MDVKTRKIRVTFFYIFVIGALIMFTSLLAYRMIQEQLMGYDRAKGVRDMLFFGSRSRKASEISAAVLHSRQTENFLAATLSGTPEAEARFRENFRETASFWEKMLRETFRFQAVVINEEQLAREPEKYNLLVLPFAHCLSEEQIQTVKSFLELGKGVIVVHSAGNRDETGAERRGWSLDSDLLGGRSVFNTEYSGAAQARIAMLGDNPLTVNLRPGTTFGIYTHNQPMAVELREPRTRPAALLETPHFGGRIPPAGRTAIAYGDYLGGRFVWLGFSPQDIMDEESFVREDSGNTLNNIVRWAAYRTVAGHSVWPQRRSASTFAVFPELDFTRGRVVGQIFNHHQIRPAFFLNRQQGVINRVLMEPILGNAELGIHCEDHSVAVSNAALYAEWEKEVRAGKTELEQVFRTTVKGFAATTARNLNFTLFSRLATEYIWITDDERNAPFVGRVSRPNIFGRRRLEPVVISQSGLSDYLLLEKTEIIEPEDLLSALKMDFEKIHRTGGLYSMSLHTRLFGSERYQAALSDFLEYVGTRDTWIASPQEIAQWLRRYENINLVITEQRQRITVNITNENRERVDAINVYLYPGTLPQELIIRSERINAPIPEYLINRERERIELTIINIRAGESRTYYLDRR